MHSSRSITFRGLGSEDMRGIHITNVVIDQLKQQGKKVNFERSTIRSKIMNAISSDLLFMLVTGHFLGAYLFQTNTMLDMQTFSMKWCSIHCFAYTVSVFVFTVPFYYTDAHFIRTVTLLFLSTFLSRFIMVKLPSRVSAKDLPLKKQ